MKELTLGFGGIALAVAGIFMTLQNSERCGRFAGAGLLLIAAGVLIPMSPAPIGGPDLTLQSGLVWAAAWAVALRIVGVAWAIWFAVPAAVRFVVWPQFHQFLPLVSWWAWIVIAPLGLFIALAGALRLMHAISASVVGDDKAAKTVSGWFGALLGSWGRTRPKTINPPEFPRPRNAPFHMPDDRP